MRGPTGSILTHSILQDFTHVNNFKERLHLCWKYIGTQIWTAAFSINPSRTWHFLHNFLADCHRTGPEQMVKCAEHILLHPLLQWLLNLEEVVRTATAGISVCQEAPDWHSKMLHLQYATGKAEWTSSGSLATPGQVIREGKDVSDVIHSAWETAQYQQEYCLMPSYILMVRTAQHWVL